MTTEEIIYIDPREVKFLVHRDREQIRFGLMKESIREVGVTQPLHVRRLEPSQRSEARGQKSELKWEAAFGEGRTRAMIELYQETKDDRFLRLPAIIKDIPQAEVVGRFLSENILRKDLPWMDQAKLIEAEVRGLKPEDRKKTLKHLAKRFFITEGHAAKLVRILAQASPKIERELGKMTVEAAEKLASLPSAGQEIVIETLQEANVQRSTSNVQHLIKQARAIEAEGKPLTKTALKQSVRRVSGELAKLRQVLKLKRLHHSLGPENLRMLLSDKQFRSAMDSEQINYSKFEEAT